jgi:RNase P subunit RPR2
MGMEEQQLRTGEGQRGHDRHLQALLVPTRRARPRRASKTELHVCSECGSGLVHPVDWSEAGRSHWHVELRCPECGWQDAGVYHQDVLDRFDASLDAGTAALIDDLADLTAANMEDEAERFVAALGADLVLPEDF